MLPIISNAELRSLVTVVNDAGFTIAALHSSMNDMAPLALNGGAL